MRKKILAIFILFSSGNLIAQDIHFSQVNMTPLLLNPAQAGAEASMRGTVNYRNQWSSVTSPFVTIAAAFDME